MKRLRLKGRETIRWSDCDRWEVQQQRAGVWASSWTVSNKPRRLRLTSHCHVSACGSEQCGLEKKIKYSLTRRNGRKIRVNSLLWVMQPWSHMLWLELQEPPNFRIKVVQMLKATPMAKEENCHDKVFFLSLVDMKGGVIINKHFCFNRRCLTDNILINKSKILQINTKCFFSPQMLFKMWHRKLRGS